MAIQKAVDFALGLYPDSVSESITIDLKTDPIQILGNFPAGFSPAKPVGAINMVVLNQQAVITVTAKFDNTKVTFTFDPVLVPTVPTSVLQGSFLYA